RRWIESFGAEEKSTEVEEVFRCFRGVALIRVRATVAHDSYERLVEVACFPEEHRTVGRRSALDRMAPVVAGPEDVGLDASRVVDAARLDPAIAEFCRFYMERREEE